MSTKYPQKSLKNREKIRKNGRMAPLKYAKIKTKENKKNNFMQVTRTLTKKNNKKNRFDDEDFGVHAGGKKHQYGGQKSHRKDENCDTREILDSSYLPQDCWDNNKPTGGTQRGVNKQYVPHGIDPDEIEDYQRVNTQKSTINTEHFGDYKGKNNYHNGYNNRNNKTSEKGNLFGYNQAARPFTPKPVGLMKSGEPFPEMPKNSDESKRMLSTSLRGVEIDFSMVKRLDRVDRTKPENGSISYAIRVVFNNEQFRNVWYNANKQGRDVAYDDAEDLCLKHSSYYCVSK